MNKIKNVFFSPGKLSHAIATGKESKGEEFIVTSLLLFNKAPKDIQLPLKASAGCMRATNMKKLN